MKYGIIVAALFVSMMPGMKLSGQDNQGVPVFGDDFNVLGLFVENWEPSKGVKCENGKVLIPPGGNLTLRRVQEGDFAFTAELTVDKPEGKDYGHCGVIIDGINFMITPSSPLRAHTAYRIPGEERSRGNVGGAISGLDFAKPCKIYVSREKLGDGYKYSYKVNGEPVDSFQIAKPGVNGKIALYGYKTSLSVDNFQLYAISGDGAKNLVVNSSFEHLQEGMPNYMRPLSSDGKYSFDGRWEDFIKSFAIDANEKVSGGNSVRMTCGDKYPKVNGVSTYDVSVMAKTPVTFSIYLKASEDDFDATLNIWELWHKNHSKPVKLSKEWKRYSFTLEKPEIAIVRGSVRFTRPGTVWADDIQVEIGKEATKYMPSPLDKAKYAANVKKEVEIEGDNSIAKASIPPVIDGDIEDIWFKEGAKIDKFFLKGGTPLNRTEAYLLCDDDNLYVAVRAYVPDVSKVRGTERKHDDLGVHGEDCIEIMLDTTFGRNAYYHLTANAAGSRTDMGPGRILAWNGNWEVKTKLNEKEKSIDYEFKFPLANFAGPDTSGKWGLNIGRNDTDSKEVYSLTHVKEANFHVPASFPAIVLPDGTLDKYKVGVKDLILVSGKDSKSGVSGTIVNLGGESMDSEVNIQDVATGEIIGKKNVKADKGNTDVVIPVGGAEEKKSIDAKVSIMVDGKERYSQRKRISLVSQLDLYTRYNYYMNEPAAVLVGSLRLPDADKLTGKVSVAGKAFDVNLEPEFAVEIPLGGIANGEHQMTLDVFKGNEKLVSGTAKLVKREYKTGATQIDHQRRCLVVDGKPYLAITPFFSTTFMDTVKPADVDMIFKNMLRLHKKMGYRCFLVISKDNFTERLQDFFELCGSDGIKIIYWAGESWRNRESIKPEQRLQTIKSDNVIAWMAVDEPELYAKSEEVEAYMEAHRKLSPYMPVFMNNTLIGIPGRYAGLKTDIIMLDDYLTNRENRKVAEMIRATDMMWEAGREERKPVFYFLAGENLSNHYRECTYAEQVAQSYGVIIAGATGISYFCSLPLYPEDYRACVDVNRELLSLEDVILSLEKTSNAAISDPVIRFMTRKLGDKLYVISLNSDNDRAADVEITLPVEFQYKGSAEVKFENRKVDVKNGKISDKFKPLERHVYVVDIVK